MPDFVNPFNGVAPDRKLTARETARAIRQALAAEEEATHQYEAIADATDNALVKAVMQDIANEERVHAGEFQQLLNLLLPDETEHLAAGAAEVDEMAERARRGDTAPDKAANGDAPITTVGNMKA